MDIKQLEKITQKQGEDISCLKTDNNWLKDTLSKVAEKVDKIEKKLLGRPSWLIATIFSILMGLVGAMATFIMNSSF